MGFLEEFLEEENPDEIGWVPAVSLRDIVVQIMPFLVVSNITFAEMFLCFCRMARISFRASADMVTARQTGFLDPNLSTSSSGTS